VGERGSALIVKKPKDEFDAISDMELIEADSTVGPTRKALLSLSSFRRERKREADRIRAKLRAAKATKDAV
jgi:hypothetical protein